jgi:hypothetical protein
MASELERPRDILVSLDTDFELSGIGKETIIHKNKQGFKPSIKLPFADFTNEKSFRIVSSLVTSQMFLPLEGLSAAVNGTSVLLLAITRFWIIHDRERED